MVEGVTDVFFSVDYTDDNVTQYGEVYGINATVTNFIVEMTGYYLAEQSGEYTFTLNASSSVFLLFGIDGSCCGGMININAPVAGYSADPDYPIYPDVNSTYVNLTAGNYYPMLLYYVNDQWAYSDSPATLAMSVTLPNGTITSDFSNVYQVELDNDSAFCVAPIITTIIPGSVTSTFTSAGPYTTYLLILDGTTSYTTIKETTVYVETPTPVTTATTTTFLWSESYATTFFDRWPYITGVQTGVITYVDVALPTPHTLVTATQEINGTVLTTITETGLYTDNDGLTGVATSVIVEIPTTSTSAIVSSSLKSSYATSSDRSSVANWWSSGWVSRITTVTLPWTGVTTSTATSTERVGNWTETSVVIYTPTSAKTLVTPTMPSYSVTTPTAEGESSSLASSLGLTPRATEGSSSSVPPVSLESSQVSSSAVSNIPTASTGTTSFLSEGTSSSAEPGGTPSASSSEADATKLTSVSVETCSDVTSSSQDLASGSSSPESVTFSSAESVASSVPALATSSGLVLVNLASKLQWSLGAVFGAALPYVM